jgi:hypothetical protein
MHKDVNCNNRFCGKTFNVDGDHSPDAPEGTFPAHCPECGYVNDIQWPMGGTLKVTKKKSTRHGIS